jgi:tetratricopeptide (TPR) repeat protein
LPGTARANRSANPESTCWDPGILATRHDYEGGLAIVSTLMERAATPELAAQMGDLHLLLGQVALADRYYEQAEQLERDGWRLEEPQPAALARFLAERNRKIAVAVEMAERAAASRQDIFTEDALAWAYSRAGRLEEALEASARALRTGTRDRRLLYHAAAINHALGDDETARRLIDQALDGTPMFDLVNGPAAVALRDRLTGSPQVARR